MKIKITLLLLLFTAAAFAQRQRVETAVDLLTRDEVSGLSHEALHIRKTAGSIRADGILDEPAWEQARVAVDFSKQFPVDTGLADTRTEVRLTFDDRNLYVGVVCWQEQKNYTIQSLKRDFANGVSDGFNLLLNPSKDGLNGFMFSISPLNVQREALIDYGANLSFEWDNRWASAVKNFDDHWVAEMAIPFKSLRYTVSEGVNSWNVNFVHVRLKNREVSTWHRVPRQYDADNLAFCRPLIWDEQPPHPRLNLSLIPYVSGRYSTEYRRDPVTLKETGHPHNKQASIGGDAKIAVTPSLNLDLTINPDFSQVEVDRQVANLSRFELFFPERRQFFLENRDLFAMFGFPNSRPFFSRRVGLARNPLNGQNETVPILAGARLSGKLNDDWRIGLLNIQTRRVNWDSVAVLPSANFTVATVQRKVLQRSAISAIFVDKENFLGNLSEAQKAGFQRWSRVAGLEFNLYSQDNRWEGEWYYHRSFSPDPKQRGQTAAHFLGYTDRNFSGRLGYMLVDSNYTADAGFVPRVGFQSFFPGFSFKFYPKGKLINNWSVGINGDLTYALDFQETDHEISVFWDANLQDQSSLNLSAWHAYTYLFAPFDPTNLNKAGTQPLDGQQGYTYSGARLRMSSSSTYNLQGNIDLTAGQYFNGSQIRVGGEVGYRVQPVGAFTLSYSYNHIRLPAPYPSADFWLLGPRAELSFSRKFFASAFFQWNTQTNNFNVNARLQWRFAPVSDAFLVYTDNSFAVPVANTDARFLTPKNRTLVLKIVYWLNV